MRRRLSILVLLSSTVAFAQAELTGYHAVNCVKVQPGKGPEYVQFRTEQLRRLMQSAADDGMITAWYSLRGVMPSGTDARCDYVNVTIYPGLPSEPLGLEQLGGRLQKAGLRMTPAEYVAKRGAATTLVASELWRTAMRVGEMQKGDYVYVNFMKVHDMQAWMDLEDKLWKPMAATWVKQGTMRAWAVNLPVVPSGTGLPYHAVTIDAFPKWDAVFTGRPMESTFKHVHAGKDLNEALNQIGKTRDLSRRELLVVEDKVMSAKPTTQR